MFGKFTGCKDLQENLIYLYGISKVNSPFNNAATCRYFFFRKQILLFFANEFDFQVKIKTLDRLTPISKANKAISNLLIF